MKKIIIPLSICFSLLNYANTVRASEFCYDVVGGAITSVNTSAITQFGTMTLDLIEQETDEEVHLEGLINGTITSEEGEPVTLSHIMIGSEDVSNSDVSFLVITKNDTAVITGGVEGCSMPITESVTDFIPGISRISRAKINSIDITINGYINVINAGECLGVPNVFEDISGVVCTNKKID